MEEDAFFGRLNDPSAGAWVTGPCGVTVEFYLVIEKDRIERVCYYTDGCQHTRRCGHAVAQHVQGKTMREAITLSAGQILAELPDLPQSNQHCAILAVSSLYRTIGQYWVQQLGH